MRLPKLCILAAGLMVCGSWYSALGQTGASISGVVPADLPIGVAVPVVVPVPEQLARRQVLNGKLTVAGEQVATVVLQTEPADEVAGTAARAWFIWTAKAEQLGKPVSVQLSQGDADAEQRACQVRYEDPLVNVRGPDDNLILAYRHSKPDPALRFPMTSYIHPLVGLDGEMLTDCAPGDHFHHRGLFWAWVRVARNDEIIGENWIPKNIDNEAAEIKVADGPVLGRFAARQYWVHQPGFPGKQSSASPDPSKRLIQEDVICRIFGTNSGGRAIDIDLTLTAMQDDLKLGGQTAAGKGYGGVTLRFSTAQEGKATQPRVEADGTRITEANLNGLKALWVDWTGVFNGPNGKPLPHRSGGALFVHPSHPPLPESPPEWITRFYGPINVAYPGLEMLPMPKGKPLRLKYRIWIHRGDAGEAGVDGQYKAYAADWKWSTARQ